MPANRDPDEQLVVLFKYVPIENLQQTREQGRPVFDDVEMCEIRSPGNKDVKVFRSTEVSRWVDHPSQGQVKETYAERFRHQYQQFKRDAAQTKSGTPLDIAPFLTDGRRAELRAQNVYTVEQLADMDGQELKNLGPNGRVMKNDAMEYIAKSLATAPNKQMAAELEVLRARNAVLEEDLLAKKQREAETPDGEEFAGMTVAELKDYIAAQSGFPPQGNISRKTLIHMAKSCRPEKVA